MERKPRFIQCDDAKIAYYEQGRGAPLFLLHGNHEDSTYFREQIQVFAQYFRVIAVDSRGHGRSEAGMQGLSLARMARDLKIVMNTLSIRHAHFLGFSDGGNLALKFAVRFPENVDRLVLNGANVNMFTGIKLGVQLPLYPKYALACIGAAVSQKLREQRDIMGLMVWPYGVTLAMLHQIRIPVLVIAGQHDLIRQRHTQAIVRALPDSRLVILPGADHFCAAGQPERFNAAVLDFLLDR